jgi:ERF superfamily
MLSLHGTRQAARRAAPAVPASGEEGLAVLREASARSNQLDLAAHLVVVALQKECSMSNELTVAPANDPVSLVLAAVIRAAADPAVDVSKMRELMGLQKELLSMNAETEFNQAFHLLQMELPRVKRNGSVDYKNKQGALEKAFNFAKWEDIDEAIRPLLHAHGFVLSYDTAPRAGDGGGVIVTGTLRHVAGHSKTASIPVPLDVSGGKNSNQGYGSALSYGKRYTTTALLNLVFEGEDDDAVAAGITYVNAAQVAEIEKLIQESGSNKTIFMQHFEVTALENLTAEDYVGAVNMLNVKKARKK